MGNQSAEELRGLIVVKALWFARDAGFDDVVVETDAINVKTALSSQGYDLASCGMLISDIKALLLVASQNYSIKFKHRSCNTVADSLAKFGCALDSGAIMVWPDGHLAFVNYHVAADIQSAPS
ncbi:hypothetical protein EJB05_40828, partial [Eragrostis curvula]